MIRCDSDAASGDENGAYVSELEVADVAVFVVAVAAAAGAAVGDVDGGGDGWRMII